MKANQVELLHDLRMPLQVMVSCAQLLEDEVGENQRARGYVELLLGSAAEMQKMLSGAMETQRCDTRELRLVRSNLVVKTWEICARCRLYAERKGVLLSFHANTDQLEMALDEEKYARILLNLLSNAIRFTAEGGEIRVAVTAMGDRVEVSVTDEGSGIAPERLDSVFELHETDGGYGYGLYIARNFARMMGGALWARSEQGCGSCFTLRLPVHSVEAAAGAE